MSGGSEALISFQPIFYAMHNGDCVLPRSLLHHEADGRVVIEAAEATRLFVRIFDAADVFQTTG